MQRFLKRFLIFIVAYHLIVTCIGYGLIGGKYPEMRPLLRDAVRLLFIICCAITYRKSLKGYLRQRKQPRIWFLILIIFSTGMSYVKGKSFYDMFVGIKYGIIYIPIFLSATFLGYVRDKEKSGEKRSDLSSFFLRIKNLLAIVLIGWFIWQIAKFIRPDFFMHIGYGPLNDFKFWVKPPIYYLTGYQGTRRRQGIFSGPNNYGYLLIALLPLICTLFKTQWQNIKQVLSNKRLLWNMVIIILRILAILCSLSRTARIGGIVAIALLNADWIRKHKKIARGFGALALIGIVALSAFKGTSTLAHIQAKFGSIQYVIQRPSGYGLGTSWPAVHYHGTILPENYYIQLMLDIGTLGFLLRIMSIRQIQRIHIRIKRHFKETNSPIYTIRRSLSIGWIAMLIMGFFLHVFEDSMVNYIFFLLRGITSGYLLQQTKNS